jgi:superfamily II DNA helicase RecQ
MENLAQEMGRAGRDEKRSVCKIMYSPSDKAKIQSALHKDPAYLERQGGKCLQSVVNFCTRIKERADIGKCALISPTMRARSGSCVRRVKCAMFATKRERRR